MTAVTFRTHVGARLRHACAWLRAAMGQGGPAAGRRIAVWLPAEDLARFDAELWSFDPLAFVPHQRADRTAGVHACTPVVLTAAWPLAPGQVSGPGVTDLLNLTLELPPATPALARIVQIIGDDDADLARGRELWRGFLGQGFAPALEFKGQGA